MFYERQIQNEIIMGLLEEIKGKWWTKLSMPNKDAPIKNQEYLFQKIDSRVF